MAIQVNIHGNNNGTIAETVVINNYSQQPSYPQPQHKDIEEAAIVEETKEEPHPEPVPTVQYSRFLKRGANPTKSDDEVQQNFVNAALSGPSALVEYLISPEGKLYFDVQNVKPSLFIKTVNQECGTNIKLKSYQTARNRKM